MFKFANNIFATIKGEQYGLYINIDSENELHYYVVNATAVNNKIKIIDSHEYNTELELLDFIHDKGIVSIFISGKGIIYKSFNENFIDPEIAFNSVFKNIDSSQFYYQFNGNMDLNWIAISRKNIIDSTIQNLLKKVLIKSIKILPPQNIDYINSEKIEQNKHFGKLELNFSNSLESILVSETDSQIYYKDNEFSCNYGPAIYALHIKNNTNILVNYNSKADEINKYKIANYSIFYSSILVFILLIVNILIFNKYSSEVALQQNILFSNNSNISIINNLESELKKKQKIIKTDGINNNFIYSRAISTLSEQVPKSINLLELSIIPIRFRSDKIIIN